MTVCNFTIVCASVSDTELVSLAPSDVCQVRSQSLPDWIFWDDELFNGLLKRSGKTKSRFRTCSEALNWLYFVCVFFFFWFSIREYRGSKLPIRMLSNAIRSAVSTVSAVTIFTDSSRLLRWIFRLCCGRFIRWTLNGSVWRIKIAARFWFNVPIIHFHIHDFHEFNSSGQFLNFLLHKWMKSQR